MYMFLVFGGTQGNYCGRREDIFCGIFGLPRWDRGELMWDVGCRRHTKVYTRVG